MHNNITINHGSITCTETHTVRYRSQPIGPQKAVRQRIPTGAVLANVPEEYRNTNLGVVLDVVTKHVRSVLNILRYDLVTRRIHCTIDIAHRDDRRYYDESHTQGGQHFTLTGYTKTLEKENKNNEETPFFDLAGERISCIHDSRSQMAHGPTISRPVW